jgi:CO/xanthine dehydrogenase FAD-binding subunit
MKPAPFQMYRPQSLTDALRIVSDHAEDVRLLAGGQSLVPLLNFRLAAPAVIVDLNKVSELAGIRRNGPVLRIGAMTRQQDILESSIVSTCAPMLQKAAIHVGHLQTRSRGTVGGSIVQADPSAELPLALVALDATLSIANAIRMRQLPIRSFFKHAMVTDLAPNEILTHIDVPVAEPGHRCAFREFARRHGDFAIVSAAIADQLSGMTVALGGIAPTPHLCPHVADALIGQPIALSALDRAIDADLSGTDANSDLQATGEFRRHLARVLINDCLTDLGLL